MHDVEVGELAEVGVGLTTQPGRLAALKEANVLKPNRQLQAALGRIEVRRGGTEKDKLADYMSEAQLGELWRGAGSKRIAR